MESIDFHINVYIYKFMGLPMFTSSGAYNFMARDAEDFPQFVDAEGYVYRVWPFQNIVRYVPGGSKTVELSKVIGKFHHLDPNGNMVLLNGSYCPQIDAQTFV